MRLVSLCPSITESLVAFGLLDELVGVTRYCIHPKEAVRALRKVGGTKNPDLAAIAELAPDLVFLNAEENRAEDLVALALSHRVDVSYPTRVREVPDLLRRFGALTGRLREAEDWARKIEEALARLESAPGRRFTYAYLIWKDPWMAAADGTYVSDLVSLAGGTNVFANASVPYPQATEEELVSSKPDVVLLPDEPFPFREPHAAFFRSRLPGAEVRLVAGDDFCWHGVRTLRGLEAAAALRASVTETAAR
jgi:ABC-type Fe3+-hydroxamate transport system substrate-binding protein